MKDWKDDLANSIKKTKEEKHIKNELLGLKKLDTENFYSSKVVPAFEELKTELEKHGKRVGLHPISGYATITVDKSTPDEFSYSIEVVISPRGAYPVSKTRFIDEKTGGTYVSEGHLRSGSQSYDISDISKEEIIHHFIANYKLHMQFSR